jgi:hypothetical protein
VAPYTLLGVAHSIRLCLIDALHQHHLLDMAYRQHIAGMEATLSAASQRADALRALVVASVAAAVRLELRVDLLDCVLRDQLLLTDRLSSECRDLQLAQLAQPQSPIRVHCTARPVTGSCALDRSAVSARYRHGLHSGPSIMFSVDHPADSQSSLLQQLAAETTAAHRAGTDELSLAALMLDDSGLSSVSDLRVPDGLVPAVVCSRCERSGCRADVCQQPCRLCDSAHGHEQSCLRVGFTDPTITRFASTAEEDLSTLGIQAVYPSAVPAAPAPEVSGAAAAPALSAEDLELLQRVRPTLMEVLSHAQCVPCTANGTPLRLVFDELPPGERFELCRLFDRGRDDRLGSADRTSAQSAFAQLCKVVTAGFSART